MRAGGTCTVAAAIIHTVFSIPAGCVLEPQISSDSCDLGVNDIIYRQVTYDIFCFLCIGNRLTNGHLSAAVIAVSDVAIIQAWCTKSQGFLGEIHLPNTGSTLCRQGLQGFKHSHIVYNHGKRQAGIATDRTTGRLGRLLHDTIRPRALVIH